MKNETEAIPSSAARGGRAALGALGVGFGLWGGWLLLQSLSFDALIRLPLWLGGAVLVDDFLLVPITLAAGWLLTRWSAGPDRHRIVGTVRTTGLYVGITTLIAIPLLLRQGTGANPTVLPRDYLRDWLLLEATIIVTGVAVLLVQRRFTFSRSRASSGDIGGR
ncbi:hypothetical protein [Kribbella sp. CA-293567]|uniref:hypothetical protein n=1 Tax=Kribbella sp. CA-293567 TaxID=3002436 RepID=UPI0022DE2372|nr:hypothetical protein [Kribbella sp. CA-293567]WBQ04581.1 hypothetical protein OX958_32030 [Kribbella sp. CA-293567]